jgi:cell division protein FtsB|tara:strand:- start:99 stop:452 length:354 start_codon:yes stop_codon:yes gene_type:complete
VSKEISEEKILGSKFTLSLQTMIAAGTGLASLIGMWYALQADIQEAKELPVPLSLFSQEYPSKGISDYNWSPSYEQYKQQISQLQNDNDEIFETIEELQQEISILKQQVIDLRIKVR